MTTIALLNCTDGAIPRAPKPIVSYKVELTNEHTKEKTSQTVECQQVYDSQCSTMGNQWHWKGKNEVNPLITTSSSGDMIRVNAPHCWKLEKFVGESIVGKESFDNPYIRLGIWHIPSDAPLCPVDDWTEQSPLYRFCRLDKRNDFGELVFKIPLSATIEKL